MAALTGVAPFPNSGASLAGLLGLITHVLLVLIPWVSAWASGGGGAGDTSPGVGSGEVEGAPKGCS